VYSADLGIGFDATQRLQDHLQLELWQEGSSLGHFSLLFLDGL
jgi:hypothetical protein